MKVEETERGGGRDTERQREDGARETHRENN